MRIGIIGAKGRMGQALIEVAEEDKIEIGALIEKEGLEGECKGIKYEDDLRKVYDRVDVFLEFTDPEATLQNTLKLIEKPKPYVVGTTSLKEIHFEKFKELSNKVPVFYSPNMSLGIHLIAGFFKKFSEFLKDYELEIMELHHTGKKDAPSGTALFLFNEWKENVNKDSYPVFERREMKKKNEVLLAGFRVGNIPGEHTLFISKGDEVIELTHKIYSRKVFARGALFVAKKILSFKKGFYTFKELLGEY
ncbi:MAG: 4-hydroxy-tetrahydrodipicolinate reductase [candidate division WOR-3 bacterium]